MAEYLQKSPSSATTPFGHWSNPANANADGGGYANVDPALTNRYKDHYNFGYAFDTSDTIIVGIQVLCDLWIDLGCTRNRFKVQISNNGGLSWSTGEEKLHQITNSEATLTFGGSTNMLGATLTAAQANSSDFRVRTTLVSASFCIGGADLRDDWTRVRLWYVRRKSLGLQYAVFVPTVNIDKALQYRVKSQQATTKSLKYSVLSASSIQRGMLYRVRQTYLTDHQKDLKYTVTSSQSITQQLKYSVGTTDSMQKSLAYKVRASSAQQLSMKYVVGRRTNRVGVAPLITRGGNTVLRTKPSGAVLSSTKASNMVQSKQGKTIL